MGTVWYDKMETHRLKCECECEMSLPKHYRPVNDACLAATSTVVYCCRFFSLLIYCYQLLVTQTPLQTRFAGGTRNRHAPTTSTTPPRSKYEALAVSLTRHSCCSAGKRQVRSIVHIYVYYKVCLLCNMYTNAVIYHQTSYWNNNWYGRRMGKVDWSSLTLND